ncbi:hypothetical protein GIS00_17490 [Nakamurella sp. YIM 132087]|uniref:VanZ-like domain-containing protein n=1 Tax=Nakamurella alba TaxID=2665158 RepID=A0A7K1FNS2_9ACTN|nr:VanZ family protein [Nakamurella alba]MTD15730.1 hypothetical protein [Nakamurella alba]
MPDIVRLLGGSLGAAAALLSVLAIGIGLVVACSGPRSGSDRVRILARTGIVVGALVCAVLLFSPVGRTEAPRALDLDLWQTIEGATQHRVLAYQFVGNLLLLTWLAVLLPLASRRIGAVGSVLVCAVVSVTVEAVQYLIGVGRVSSVGDVFCNVLGAAVAAGLFALVRTMVRPAAGVRAVA